MKNPNDGDAVLIADYRATGNIHFLNLAFVLEVIRRYHKTYGDPSQDVPIPAEIVQMAEEAALVAAGEIKRPSGRPRTSMAEKARLRGLAVKELLKPDYSPKALIEAFKKIGISRTTALTYIKPGLRQIEEARRQFKIPR